MVGTYNADDGFTGSVSQSGDTFLVEGTFTKQDDANDQLEIDPGEAKGYYLPIQLNGTKGTAIKLMSNNKVNVFGETNDTDTTMVLVLAVDPASPTLKFAEYVNESAADSDIDPKYFIVDCSGCSFN